MYYITYDKIFNKHFNNLIYWYIDLALIAAYKSRGSRMYTSQIENAYVI